MTDKLDIKSSKIFQCVLCDYYTSRKSQYDRHIMTTKHKNTDKILTNTDAEGSESSETELIVNNFSCSCGKEYKHRQSLFNHKKKCQQKNQEIIDETQVTPELIMSVLQQNKELQQMLMEQNKTIIELSKNIAKEVTIHSKA